MITSRVFRMEQIKLFPNLSHPGARLSPFVQVSDGQITPEQATVELERSGWRVWVPDTETLHEPLHEPTWPLRLVLAWIVENGDPDATSRTYHAYRHWNVPWSGTTEGRAAYQKLTRQLRFGRLHAEARPASCRSGVEIAPVEWKDLRLHPQLDIVLRAEETFHNPSYTFVRVPADEVKTLWPPITASVSNARATIKSEGQLRKMLVALMRERPNDPISKAKLREDQRFLCSSKRMFDRAFRAAVQEAEASAWSASGRRRSSASSLGG